MSEPRHKKTNKLSVHQTKTLTSLGGTQWVLKDPSFFHVDSEDPGPTERMLYT